jgi:hypothetical protein
MKQLLVGGNVAYTSAASPSALTAGQIGIYTENNVLITAANVNDHKGKPFYIAAHSTIGPRITNPIHTIINLQNNAYAAPVKQVVTISGIALANPATKFDEYGVKVIDVSKGTSPSENRITSSAIGVFGNVAALVDRLVAIINGNSNSIVVASRSTNDLVLTAKEFDNRFRVAVQGKLELATITYSTAWSPGVGHGPRLLEIEKDFLAYEGVRNRIDARYPQPPYQINPASTYDVIVLDWVYTANQKAGTDSRYNRNLKAVLAFVAGAAQRTTSNTILTELESLVGPEGGGGG